MNRNKKLYLLVVACSFRLDAQVSNTYCIDSLKAQKTLNRRLTALLDNHFGFSLPGKESRNAALEKHFLSNGCRMYKPNIFWAWECCSGDEISEEAFYGA